MTQAKTSGFARHGGRIDDAMRAYPQAPQPWLDLSTGINPAPWTPPHATAVDPAPLPSLAALAVLEEAAARHFGTAPDRVAAVPGSEVALRLLGALRLPRPVVALRPCYGTYGEVADDIVASVAATSGTILLASPNNPDGRVIAAPDLHRIAREQAEKGGWLVVDEAFADAMPTGGILPGLAHDAPVVVLRSFGKFFGLAGVRLGFVVAPPAMIARVRHLLGDWPVSAHAIAWGQAAYSDEAWIEATRVSLAAAAARLDALLARHGLVAAGASPLFRLVERRDAQIVFDRLAGAGILTRPFADRRDWLRFGLPGDDAGFARLDKALARG